MKNILSILLFLFLFNYLSVSQSYHKFINDTLYWDVSFAEMGYICGSAQDIVMLGPGVLHLKEIQS
jgi:hypothetical protein